MNKVSIKPVDASEFDSIFVLLQQLWETTPLDYGSVKEMFAINLRADHIVYFAAVKNDVIIGFCSMTIRNNLWQGGLLANIDELVVDHHHRGAGVGNQLLHHVLARALAEGCKRIELDSSTYRTGAHRFYEAMGFEKRAYLFSRGL